MLNPFQDRLHALHLATQQVRNIVGCAGKPAGLVQHVDKMKANNPLRRVLDIERQLLRQMFPETQLITQCRFEIAQAFAKIASPARSDRRGRFKPAAQFVRHVARMLVIPDVLIIHIERFVVR